MKNKISLALLILFTAPAHAASYHLVAQPFHAEGSSAGSLSLSSAEYDTLHHQAFSIDLSENLIASTPGSNTTSWSAINIPPELSLSSSGKLSGTLSTVGSHTIEVEVRRGKYRTSQSFTVKNKAKVVIENGARKWSHGEFGSSCSSYLSDSDLTSYSGDTGSGAYWIHPQNSEPYIAHCDQEMDGGGWQRIGYFSASTTSYTSTLSNPNPTGNWQAPLANVPGFPGKLLFKISSTGKWAATMGSGSTAYVGSTGYEGLEIRNNTTTVHGTFLWQISGISQSFYSFNPCGSNQNLVFSMALTTQSGTYAGIQVWQEACNSGTYWKTEPFELYSK